MAFEISSGNIHWTAFVTSSGNVVFVMAFATAFKNFVQHDDYNQFFG